MNPHAFRQGELITAELELPGQPPAQASPPAEQWQFAGLLLDPPAGCGTVAKPCFLTDSNPGGIMSGLGRRVAPIIGHWL